MSEPIKLPELLLCDVGGCWSAASYLVEGESYLCAKHARREKEETP